MALADNEIWGNQNLPPISIEDATTQAQNDVGQGLICGEPVHVDGLNFALSKYSRCLQEELKSVTSLAGIAYDPNNPDNIANAISAIICDFVSGFTFFGKDQGSGTLSVTLPAGSSWCVIANYIGGGSNPPYTFGTNAGSTVPVLFLSGGENTAGGNNAGVFAGGTTFTVPQTASVNGLLSVKAFNLDCPV